jgi:hypothetical protein
MKNFSELLATDAYLTVEINNQTYSAELDAELAFDQDAEVKIDGFDILPKYHYLAEQGQLTIHIPFYQWLHEVTAQGWLLKPAPISG